MLEKEKILFIGAGASYGARPEDPPPMGDKLLQWLKDQCKSFKRQFFSNLVHPNDLQSSEFLKLDEIEKLLNEAHNEETYEKFIERVIKEKSWIDAIKIQKFMSIAFFIPRKFEIKNCFQKKQDLYYDLMKVLKVDHTWNIISLNYDFLLEEALQEISDIEGKISGFQYQGFEENKINHVNIFKPHGSINFYGTRTIIGGLSQTLAVADANKSNMPECVENIYTLIPKLFKYRECMEEILSEFRIEPVMAHYTEGKYPEWSLSTLEKIRETALNLIKPTSQITIIGVKPIFNEKDDPFVSKILNKMGTENLLDGSITYVGFDKRYRETNEDELITAGSLEIKEKILHSNKFSDCEKIKIKFGRKVKVYSDGLERYIEEIKSEISKDSQVHRRNQQPSRVTGAASLST